MSSPYSVARRAELDLDEIWAYIGTDNISAANRMMDRFRQKFAMLGRQPLIGETCDHLRPGLRFVPLGNYVIYYRVDDAHVTIVRVLHAGRDATRLL